MLSNAYFLAKFRFDTAESEPAKNLQKFPNFANFADPNHLNSRAQRTGRRCGSRGRRRGRAPPRCSGARGAAAWRGEGRRPRLTVQRWTRSNSKFRTSNIKLRSSSFKSSRYSRISKLLLQTSPQFSRTSAQFRQFFIKIQFTND